ncbi:metal ABC transporter solute-binding protein, Zn/Mn family [Synechococcus sp. PCC 7336]|uniref:metal ABC transporter solute-binding protein, Zn/Mn family n=1 Tax=Synechococcus sp. PCC 7336 TaxID=195250 RepID=UPI00037DEF04|nr:zinc ABC transporter substrate-binding protein [Synechococcus sp. PCC 7336]
MRQTETSRDRLWTAVVAIGLGLGLASCGRSPQVDAEKPLLVASYSVLCDMAEQIAGDTVELDCLIAFDRDPHTYEGTPSDRQAIELADAVLYAGLNFEPSVIRMVQATHSPAPKVPVHELAVQELIEVGIEGEEVPDPHIWHDVENGIRMVELLRDTSIELSPEHADLYRSRTDRLLQELEQLDEWIGEQIQTIPSDRRLLVTTHDAMGYYSRAYGLEVAGTLLGLSPEEEPTAARVRELVQSIRSSGVPTVFAELTTNDRVLRVVASEAGVEISDRVLIADGIGRRGSPEGSYQGMLEYNTCAIVDGLGGTCSPFVSSVVD